MELIKALIEIENGSNIYKSSYALSMHLVFYEKGVILVILRCISKTKSPYFNHKYISKCLKMPLENIGVLKHMIYH